MARLIPSPFLFVPEKVIHHLMQATELNIVPSSNRYRLGMMCLDVGEPVRNKAGQQEKKR